MPITLEKNQKDARKLELQMNSTEININFSHAKVSTFFIILNVDAMIMPH